MRNTTNHTGARSMIATGAGIWAAAAAVMVLTAPNAAHAQSYSQSFPQADSWLLRVRAVYLDSADKDTTGLNLSINNRYIPEVDISYFFTPEFAAELVLTYPQKQKLRSNGTQIGTFKHLPPTLLAQYHFTGLGAFKPYVGAGINVTRISNVEWEPAVQAALQPSLDKSSVGAAVQAGVDVAISPTLSLNFDIKKVQIRTDVKAAGTQVGEFKIDPVLIGVGVGFKF